MGVSKRSSDVQRDGGAALPVTGFANHLPLTGRTSSGGRPPYARAR